MAKPKETGESSANTTQTQTDPNTQNGSAAAGTTQVSDDRYKMLNDASGKPVRRSEYIKKLWQEDKMSRSDITKHINGLLEAQGQKKIKYQIVFAATKKLPGGPDKPATAPAEGAAAPGTAA